jgi:GntR family transcriptional regulator
MTEIRTDRRSLARQVRDALKDMIFSDDYKAGDQIPSEETLAETFKVSRPTVREALKYLEEERVIICRHGVGRFLTSDPASILQGEITRLESVTAIAQRLGITISTQVLSLSQVEADNEIRSHLDLETGALVYSLERARLAKQETVIYSFDIFPCNIVKSDINPGEFSNSLVSIMESQWGEQLAYSRAKISAVILEEKLCDKLHVNFLQPWILLEQVNYNNEDHPILYSRDYHRGDKFQFDVIRRRY